MRRWKKDMPHSKNIQIFLLQLQPNELMQSYGILVALELALKDAGHKAGQAGHDVPAMLGKARETIVASGNLVLAPQIASLEAKLKNDLTQLLCTGASGSMQAVPSHSYPYVRYTRFQGDWGGVGETPAQAMTDLLQTCRQILSFLQTNSIAFGVSM